MKPELTTEQLIDLLVKIQRPTETSTTEDPANWSDRHQPVRKSQLYTFVFTPPPEEKPPFNPKTELEIG